MVFVYRVMCVLMWCFVFTGCIHPSVFLFLLSRFVKPRLGFDLRGAKGMLFGVGFCEVSPYFSCTRRCLLSSSEFSV